MADLKDRAMAFLLDSVILYATIFILFSIFISINPTGDQNLFYMLVLLPIFLFYTLFSEILMSGLTLGKKAMGLRVIKLNGQFASHIDYMIRWLFRWLDLWLSLFVIASVLVNSTQYGQRLGDILAGTGVIKFNLKNTVGLDEILSIENQGNYAPVYPQVIQLKDEDMILVKRALYRQQLYNNKAHNTSINDLAFHLQKELKIENNQANDIIFLQTLLKDYVVLTRS